MTRLLQLIAGQKHGGAEAFFTRLALALQRSGQDQKLAIRRDPARAAALRSAGIDVTELAFGGRLDFTTRPALRRLVKSWEPQVALGWMSRATSMLPTGNFVRAARLGGYYDLKYYRRADHLIGNTRDIVNHLIRQGWPADRAHYLPNFVDATPAPPLPRTLFGADAGAPLVLALGRLHPVKGFDVLLHALARLERVQLWLAGDGPERASLEALCHRLGLRGRVHFLGWREDVPALLASADLLVCPSRYEPLGNVVIEAWAHRLPVVAAAAAGPRDLVRTEENGLLVPVEDADALAAAIARLISDRRRADRLVAAGLADYRHSFTETAVVGAWRDFFARIAA